MSRSTRAQAFLDALPEPAVTRDADPPGLEALLEGLVRAGKAGAPGVELDEATFVAHVAARLDPSRPFDEALRDLCAGDLYLACACGRGDARAQEAVHEQVSVGLISVLRRAGADQDLAEETAQDLLIRLLWPRDGGPAEILDYRGRGSLRGWLRVIAVRRAARALEAGRRRVGDEALVEAIATAPTLSIDPDRPRQRVALTEALRVGLGVLTVRQRNLLRHQIVDGLNVREVAAIYRVHHSSVARWLVAAREELAAAVRAALLDQLQMDGAEADSLVRSLQAQVDLSLDRLL